MEVNKLKTLPNMVSALDMSELKQSCDTGRLQGANIFARLFKIVNDAQFARSSDPYIDLTHYEVYHEEWLLLFGFIRNGVLPVRLDEEHKVDDLNTCYNLSLKLGGIPEYEKYYAEQTRVDDTPQEPPYNPLSPEEDHLVKYTWRVSTITMLNLNKNESATQPIDNNSCIFYIRRPTSLHSDV